MLHPTKVLWIISTFVLATAAQLTAAPAPQNDSGSIVIVLKNGKTQSFNLSEVARIEFNQPGSLAAAPGRARFYGDWTVGDGAGGKFTITLRADGSAHKTMGDGSGTWTLANGEAQISWDDGWHDVIRKAGAKYEKAAYAPGASLTGKPDNVADARKHAEVN